jgi:lipopolysaccharide transport system permease protein
MKNLKNTRDFAEIVAYLIQLEIRIKFKGTISGRLWMLIQPLLVFLLYLIVFGHFLGMSAKYSEQTNGGDYAVALFIALAIHQFFSECIQRATTLIQSNATYIKKISVETEIFPCQVTGVATLSLLIGLSVAYLFQFFMNKSIGNALYHVLVVITMVIMGLGLVFLVSSISVFAKDLTHLVGPLTNVLLFMSPIFYPFTSIPDFLQIYFYFNPLTIPLVLTRSLVDGNATFNWNLFIAYFLASCMIFLLGVTIFRRLKSEFADVL